MTNTEPEPSVVRGPVREVPLEGPCPACGQASLTMRSLTLDLPYFGEALQTVVLCEACGFRNADIVLTRENEPRRAELRVSTRAHLDARIARSGSGTVRIPELDASIEPGPRSEAFVSNVEGVVRKFRDVARSAVAMSAKRKDRTAAEAVVARLDGLIDGREPFTLVIDDPTGNSDILHEDVRRRPLTQEEIADLRAGPVTFDLADVFDRDADRTRSPASP